MHLGNFYIEDYKENLEFSYIPSHLDSNVLNSLCIDPSARAEVARSIVHSIKKRECDYFLTDFHAKWAMECIGYSFSLPLDQFSTIHTAISIYTAWLTLPEKRPPCISSNESFYQREILGHISLLFMDRPWDPIHAELCSQVLSLFKHLIRKSLIKIDNQKFLMKLCMLSFGPILAKNNDLSRKIGGEMSQTLFEVFLRSEVREERLWKEICGEFSKWVINTKVVHSWASVAIAISYKIANILYGEGSSEIFLHFREEERVRVDISLEHAILSWNYFVVNILDNTGKTLFDPVTHKDIVLSVTQVIDVFLNVSVSRASHKTVVLPQMEYEGSQTVKPLSSLCKGVHMDYLNGIKMLPMPSIRGLINIFGPWLFAQANTQGSHVLGQAGAIGSLCKIFYQASGPAPENYLAKFYKTLFKGFKFASENNTQVAYSILEHSVNLLTQDHRGIRILIHKSWIFKVLYPYIVSREINIGLKKHCYNVLATVVSVLKPFQKHGLSSVVIDSLVAAFGIETEASSLLVLYWTGCAYSAVVNESGVLERLVKSMINKLIILDCNSHELYVECLSTLCVMPFMISDPCLLTDVLVKDVISKFTLILLMKPFKNQTHLLCFTALNMLMHWVVRFPAVLNDFNLRSQIFETLAYLGGSEKIKDYTKYIEIVLFNTIGKSFPDFYYGCNNSTLITHAFLGSNSSDCKHFLYRNRVLLSLFNVDDGALVISRNQIGRYVWKFSPVYGKSCEFKKRDIVLSSQGGKKVKSIVECEVVGLGLDLSETEAKQLEILINKYRETSDNLKNFEPNNKIKDKKAPQVAKNEESYYRSLMAEMGFYQQDLITDLSILYKHEIQQAIEDLDCINDKELFIIPIFYLENPEVQFSDLIVKNASYSQDFHSLLTQMGVFINKTCKTIELFRSTSRILEKYGGIIVTREYYYEIISLFPGLFESSESFTIEETLQYSQLLVLWNQRLMQPQSLKTPQVIEHERMKNKTVVLLTPLTNGVIRVNILGKETNFGPLMNNMLIPLYLIGRFLTKTIANFYSSASSRLALSQRRIEIFNQLKNLSSSSEATKNGKVSAVVSHAFNNNSK